MKKIWLCLLCMFSFAVAEVEINKAVSLSESLKISGEMMNKELPAMVDAELRHDKVEVKGNTMILKFTLVNFTEKEMNAEKLKSLMEEDIRKNVCEDADSQMMLNKGMRVVYDYKGKDNKHITQFVYDAKICGVKQEIKKIKIDDLNMVKSKEKK